MDYVVGLVHAKFLSLYPTVLLTPAETSNSIILFLVLVFIPATILLPISMAATSPQEFNPFRFVGTFFPVLFGMCICHYIIFCAFLRYTSTDIGFHQNSVLAHQNFSPHTINRVWSHLTSAFLQLQANKVPISRETVLFHIHKIFANPDLEFIVDLPLKLQECHVGRPSSYFELKLLALVFPPSPQELREENAKKICRVRKRFWCWKRNTVWVVLFFLMVLFPLLVLLPLAYTLQVDIPPSDNMPSTPLVMPIVRYVFVFIFSLLFPICYVVLVVCDVVNWLASWWAKRIVKRAAAAQSRRRLRSASTPSTPPSHANNTGSMSAPHSSTSKKKKVLKLNNDLVAKADIKQAFEELDQLWRFEWKSSAPPLAAGQVARSPPPVLFSLEHYQSNVMIQARALAGQVRFQIFLLLKSNHVLERLHDPSVNKLLRLSEMDEKVGLDKEVSKTLFLLQVYHSLLENDNEHANLETELTQAFEKIHSELLMGYLPKFFVKEEQILQGQQHFTRILFLLLKPTSTSNNNTKISNRKELEFLAWIGLLRIQLARLFLFHKHPLENKRKVIVEKCEQLRDELLVHERIRVVLSSKKELAKRRNYLHLVNHAEVKRFVFWLACSKKVVSVDQVWELRSAPARQSEVDSFDKVVRQLDADVLSMISVETEDSLLEFNNATTASSCETPIESSSLFSSSLFQLGGTWLLNEEVPWISKEEEVFIVRLLALAHAGLLRLRYLAVKPQHGLGNDLLSRMEEFKSRFPTVEDERIKQLFVQIQVDHQLFSVISSNKDNGELGEEDVDQLRSAFALPIPPLANEELIHKFHQLHAESVARLILHACRNKNKDKRKRLLEAQQWAEKMQIQLPLKEIQENKTLQFALQELRNFKLIREVGYVRFWNLRLVVDFPRAVWHFLFCWILFMLPLLLGANFLLSYQGMVYSTEEAIFFFKWLGVLLPVLFVYLLALNWTLKKRMHWFGETELKEELKEDVMQILSGHHDHPEVPVRTLGEYPLMEMGDIIVSAPRGAVRDIRAKRRGRRLIIWRAGLILVVFALLPFVLFPPLLAYFASNTVDPAFLSAIWVMMFGFPLLTWMFVLYCVWVEALPRWMQHGAQVMVVWFFLFFFLPLLCASPLLQIAIAENSTVNVASLWAWLISGPFAFLCFLGWILVPKAMVKWFRSLTWEKRPLQEIMSFALQASTFCAYVFPVVSFCLLWISPASLAVQVSIGVLELAACMAAVFGCTCGVKLGVIPSELSSSSLVVVLYMLFASFVAFSAFVVGFIPAEVRFSKPVSLWACGLQLVCSAVFAYAIVIKNEERIQFGYFPEDWEVFDPTARVVVEEATSIPFVTDEEIDCALKELKLSTENKTRREREVALERARKAESLLRVRTEQHIQSQTQVLEDRYDVSKLAQVIFHSVMRKLDEDEEEKIWGKFRVHKLHLAPTLLSVLNGHHEYWLTMLDVQQRHQLANYYIQITEVEVRMINTLLGVLHPLPWSSIQTISWLTEDNVVAQPHCSKPELILKLVQLQVAGKRTLRTVCFESFAEKQTFLSFVFQLTLIKEKDSWTYSCAPHGVDRLIRVGVV